MNPKVLIVDDEENLRFTFRLMLSRAGYDATSVSDYDEALSAVSANSFDLIFTDILLGCRTGIDLLHTLREKGISCPVVMITGAPKVETAAEAVRLGAFDYIPKPVLQDTLLRVAKTAIQHKLLLEEKENYRLNLEAIFRSIDDGIVSVDREMKVVEINKAVTDICGYSREDAISKGLESLRLSCSKDCLSILKKTIDGKKGVEMAMVRCRQRDWPDQVVSIRTSPLISSDGSFSGAVMIVRDETVITQLETQLKERQHFHNIIGKSRKMQDIFALIKALANVDTTVVILGESGTGKEMVAEALHHEGTRNQKPFVKVNCSAIAENLLESELFGHVKGAFTGAVKDRIGRFELANGGTIFLDEIGDISPGMQLRLLRVLQEREFERVGDSRPVKVDVRVIAATNKDLKAKVRNGEFREDLYYRLKVVEINLPPLRERKEDLGPLIEHFIHKFNKKFGKQILSVSDDVHVSFFDYSWPGNVRELEHVLEHAFVLCNQDRITPEHLPDEFKKEAAPGSDRDKDECRLIMDTLERCGWNKAKAARMLGMSRITIYRKLEKHNIEPEL